MRIVVVDINVFVAAVAIVVVAISNIVSNNLTF
jgi:hypothetical protein